MEQVKCRVQLQHLSTISWDRRLERLIVELVPNSHVGVSPFLFCPPDSPAAVEYLYMPPAIAQLYLLRSEMAAGLSHRELTPLAHIRRPLARQRPHFHRGVCVCVCVTYVLLTFNILHFISNPDFLRLSVPVCIPAILQPRSLPCYTPTTACTFSHFPNVVPLRPSRSNPLDLATPGREQ